MLRNPACGARRLATAVAHLSTTALRYARFICHRQRSRPHPARSARLRFKPFSKPKKKRPNTKVLSLFLAGDDEARSCFATPLVVPDDSPLPWLTCRPRRFVTLALSATGSARDLTRHAPRASGSSLFPNQRKRDLTRKC